MRGENGKGTPFFRFYLFRCNNSIIKSSKLTKLDLLAPNMLRSPLTFFSLNHSIRRVINKCLENEQTLFLLAAVSKDNRG